MSAMQALYLDLARIKVIWMNIRRREPGLACQHNEKSEPARHGHVLKRDFERPLLDCYTRSGGDYFLLAFGLNTMGCRQSIRVFVSTGS